MHFKLIMPTHDFFLAVLIINITVDHQTYERMNEQRSENKKKPNRLVKLSRDRTQLPRQKRFSWLTCSHVFHMRCFVFFFLWHTFTLFLTLKMKVLLNTVGRVLFLRTKEALCHRSLWSECMIDSIFDRYGTRIQVFWHELIKT